MFNQLGLYAVKTRRFPGHPLTLESGDGVGEWTLLEYLPGQRVAPRRLPRWRCRCSCGEEREVSAQMLTAAVRGDYPSSRSCGHTRSNA